MRRAPRRVDKTTDKVNGSSKRKYKKTKQKIAKGGTTTWVWGVAFRSTTLTHHPVPVRSLLDNRLSPDDNVSGENRRGGEMPLGS